MEKKTSTRDKILIEALKLFSVRGFSAVTVAEISQKLNITAPALYKHFKNKQDIYDELVKKSNEGYSENMRRLHVDFRNDEENLNESQSLSEEEQIKVLQNLFIHTQQDEYPNLFRKMLTVEQYQHKNLGKIFNERYMDSQLNQFEAYFKKMTELGIYKDISPRILALQYISPIVVAIDVCDRDPDRRDEFVQLLADHVRAFNKAYRN